MKTSFNLKAQSSKWLQTRRFRKLLLQCRSTNNEAATDSEHNATENPLLFLGQKKDRRSFPTNGTRATIAGFGSKDSWQRNGLWLGFRSISDFHLYEVPNDRLRSATSGKHERRMKEEGFLKFVDALDKATPVHMAFFYHSGRHISDELIKGLHRRGIWTVIMSLDDKHQFSYPVDTVTEEPHQLRVARQVDLYWTTWKVGANIVRKIGGNPWYSGEAANPDFYRSLGLERDLDVVFVGANYGYRGRFIRYLLRRGISIECYGYGWPNGPVSSVEMVRLFNRAKVVLGIGGVGRMIGVKHLKGRDFEVPMCGALYLTSYNPELCDFFDIGREILCYSSLEECEELVVWALGHLDDCEIIRHAARKRSLSEHTWEYRLKSLLELFQSV